MNLMDYAFLQNMIDCSHKHESTPEPLSSDEWNTAVLRCDVHNHYQGKCELFSFATNKPAVGERYVMYVNDKNFPYKPASLTNWMGERFSYRVTLGHSWKRWGSFGPYTLQTVYATNASGERWIGRWSRDNADAVVMRRLA